MSGWSASRTVCNLDEAGQATWSWLHSFPAPNLCYNRWRYFMSFCVAGYDATSSLFSEYQLHLSLVSYLLIERLLISFQMWKAERHQNNLAHLFFKSKEISFKNLSLPDNVSIDWETFKTIPRCLSSMFMRFEKSLVGWISSKCIYRTSCQNLYYDWKHLIQRFRFLFDLRYWDGKCLN